MATFVELKDRIRRLLDDADGGNTSDQLLADAVQAAHIAILPWIPKTATSSLAAGETAYALPADCYVVDAISVNSTGEILPAAIFSPGLTRGEDISGENDWLEYPQGYITFSKEIPTGDTYDLYYLAYWTEITAQTSNEYVLEPPDHALIGVALYASAYALQPKAVSSATIRQFGTRIDSGHPEHNPVQQTADHLLRMFMNEMNRHPKYQRAQRS